MACRLTAKTSLLPAGTTLRSWRNMRARKVRLTTEFGCLIKGEVSHSAGVQKLTEVNKIKVKEVEEKVGL